MSTADTGVFEAAWDYVVNNYVPAGQAIGDAYHGHYRSALKKGLGILGNTLTEGFKIAIGSVADVASTTSTGTKDASHGDF